MLIDGGPREEMAESVENAMLTSLDREEFIGLVKRHLDLGYAMTMMLTERMRNLERKVQDLIFKTSTQSCRSFC